MTARRRVHIATLVATIVIIIAMVILATPAWAQAEPGEGGLPDWQVYGVPTLVWLVALLNYLKENFKLDTRYAFPLATGIAGVVGVGFYFSSRSEVVAAVMGIIIGAMLLGLAATGYYSGTKASVERRL